jgi:hypothetical protein
MEKEFVTYEQALALKELGFDKEICFGRWTTRPDGSGFLDTTKHSIYQGRDDLNRQCLAPLFQQAFRWFREKYDLYSYIEGAYPWFRFYINSENDRYEGYKHLLFEEAELECLKKLIEIVKEK